MSNSDFKVTLSTDGGYDIENGPVSLKANVLPPVLEGEAPVKLEFKNSYNHSLALAGMKGNVIGDASLVNSLAVKREFFVSEDMQTAAIRMVVQNKGKKAFRLQHLFPISARGNEGLSIHGKGLDSWHLVRTARHKNDLPGGFRFEKDTINFKDVHFKSAKLIAGLGITGDLPESVNERSVDAEPLMIITGEGPNGSSGLGIGVLGQELHLSTIAMVANENLSELSELSCCCEFDGVTVDPGEERSTHWVMLMQVDREWKTFRDFSEMVGTEFKIPEPDLPPKTVFCTWQFYARDFFPEDLDEMLDNLKKQPIALDVIQLDDGWIDHFGDFEAGERFPEGMKPIGDKIRAAGIMPGIWTCPLVIHEDSKMIKEHPELVARDMDGKWLPYGHAQGGSYAVDPTSPYFEEFVTNLYAKLRAWGFLYHKVDFMRSILADDNIRFHDPKVNRAQAYKIANEVLVKAMGPGSYFASCGGCCGDGNAGYGHSLRSGADAYAFWYYPDGERRHGALMRIKQNVMRNPGSRFWRVDADALMLRRRAEPFRGAKPEGVGRLSLGLFDDEEAFTQCVNQYIGGGNVVVCDRFADLDEDRRAMYRHVIPSAALPARVLRYDWPSCPNFFLTEVRKKKVGEWWTLAVGNWADETVKQKVDLSIIEFPKEAEQVAVFEFHDQKFVGGMGASESFDYEIPPHGTRLFRIVSWDGKMPVLLGTDLHLSGGAAEIESVSISDKAVDGLLKTDWGYPVKITGLFPGSNGPRVVSTEVHPGKTERFRLTPD